MNKKFHQQTVPAKFMLIGQYKYRLLVILLKTKNFATLIAQANHMDNATINRELHGIIF